MKMLAVLGLVLAVSLSLAPAAIASCPAPPCEVPSEATISQNSASPAPADPPDRRILGLEPTAAVLIAIAILVVIILGLISAALRPANPPSSSSGRPPYDQRRLR